MAQARTLTPQKAKSKRPDTIQHPSSRTITSRPSASSWGGGYTGMRATALPSPELPSPSSSSAPFKRPRLDDRHPTPYYPRVPASASPPRKRPSVSAQLPPPEKAHKKARLSPPRADNPSDQHDAASLPSPPASPVPSALSDASLPNLSDIFLPKAKKPEKQRSPTRPSATASGSSRHEHGKPSSSSQNLHTSTQSTSAVRTSPSRSYASSSSTLAHSPGYSSTPKRPSGGRPPLMPNYKKSPVVRKETSNAEAEAIRADVLAKIAEAVPSPQPARAVPQTSTPPVSGSGPSAALLKAQNNNAGSDHVAPSSSAAAVPPSASTTETMPAASSSPAIKPDVASMTASATLSLPQAGPGTPRSSAPEKTATPAAKAEQTTPAAKAEQNTPSNQQALPAATQATSRVKLEVIDLTLDSDNEAEEDKKDIKTNIARSSSVAAVSGDRKAEIAERKSASEHATDLLNELDIFDVGNIQALVNVGYKTTPTFVKRLPLLDIADRKLILEELTKEMGKLDFGILRAYLKRQGVDLES